jgi:hypothetical protein
MGKTTNETNESMIFVLFRMASCNRKKLNRSILQDWNAFEKCLKALWRFN